MNRRALPLFVSLIAVLLVAGCNSTGEGKSSSEPMAQQSAEVITLREVAGVPHEVFDLAAKEVALFGQPFPAGAKAPETVLDLEPDLANTEVIETGSAAGESLRLRKMPEGVSGVETGGVGLGDREVVEISVSDGMFFFDVAIRWQCGWLHEYLQADELGDEKAREEALNHLNLFPDLPHVRDYVDSVDVIQETVIEPLAKGDLEPAQSYYERTCSAFE